MKTKLKLGIVLGLLFVIAACQKEEVTVLDVQKNNDRDLVESFVATDGNTWATTDENENSSGVSSNSDTYNGGFNIFMGQTGDASSQTMSVTETVEAINNSDLDKTSASINISWTDERPRENKWVFVDNSLKPLPTAAVDAIPACPYENCDTAISALADFYQNLANEQCQDIYICIPCCQNGYVLYATMIFEHECGIIPPTQTF